MMRHTEGHFSGSGNASIYFQQWLPEADIRAVILIAHGAAEHGGRYDLFAAHFCGLGYAVAALDHFGHGKSDGGRCCMKSMQEHVHNLGLFRQEISRALPGVAQVLLGHSMGGLIACQYLLTDQAGLAGCVLSGPAIKTDLVPPAWQILLLKLISAVAPNLGVMQLDAGGVSRDPKEVERYLADPLNHTGKMTARMVVQLFGGMAAVQERAGEITLPLLILHGGADAMTSPSGSQFLFDNVGSSNKSITIYPGLYHEIFNEPERLEVFSELERWLQELLVPPAH